MASLSAEHINPFLFAAKKVLQEVCFIEASIQKPVLKAASFDQNSWVIMIGVTGEMKGQVLIGMEEVNACAIASKMCMTEIHEIDDFSASALSELGNMIMGNAATVFSSNGIGIDITPPTLSHGMVSFKNSYAKNICIPLVFPGGGAEIYLALTQEA